MRTALVGCGAVATEYAPDLAAHDDLALVAVADTDPERAAATAAAHGATAHDSTAALLDATDAPLVVNLTPHGVHERVTRACLSAGRHVFSEKPLATDPDAARDLVALAAREDLGLACAPTNPAADPQRAARRHLAEGRLGPVRAAHADVSVGRVGEWHDAPDSFRRAGPLLDAAVYPLTLLTELFGPVDRVIAADATRLDPAGGPDDAPDHVAATLAFADGPRLQLRASMYVPHRAGRFMSCALHGDDGSLALPDCGTLGGDGPDSYPTYARLGSEPVAVPPPVRRGERSRALGPAELAAAVREGRRPRVGDPRRGAHVVAVAAAIERRAAGEPAALPEAGLSAPPTPDRPPRPAGPGVAVPAVGFGCSEYRGGDEYVDLEPTIRAAMDAGYRLFDGAELYGTDPVVGRLLDEPGAPPRGACYLLGKVWNTNHEPDRVRAACDRALAAFGVDRLDGFALHWPEAWAHVGPLDGLRGLSHAERERLTFPRDDDGEIRTADVDLATTWRAMEGLVDRGLVRHLGLCNVDRETLVGLCERARRPPAFVQVEHHPYEPATDLLGACRERGVRVIGHTPLGPDGLLAEPAVTGAADAHGVAPAQIVLRRAVERGVVPIPSTTSRAHLVENLDLFGFALDPAERDRIDGLAGAA